MSRSSIGAFGHTVVLAEDGESKGRTMSEAHLRAALARTTGRVAELEAVLRPFAQVLERYTLNDSDIIRLADDFSGKPMNIMTAEAFNRARAALKEKADG